MVCSLPLSRFLVQSRFVYTCLLVHVFALGVGNDTIDLVNVYGWHLEALSAPNGDNFCQGHLSKSLIQCRQGRRGQHPARRSEEAQVALYRCVLLLERLMRSAVASQALMGSDTTRSMQAALVGEQSGEKLSCLELSETQIHLDGLGGCEN